MGKRGPAPTPTATLARRGSPKAKHRNNTEPQPATGIPSPPYALGEVEAQMWAKLCRDLNDIGVLTVIDGNALARYCTIWAAWRRVMNVITTVGDTYETLSREGATIPRKRPEVEMSQKYADQLLRLEQQFGLTPASRSSIEVKPKQRDKGRLKFFPASRAKGA